MSDIFGQCLIDTRGGGGEVTQGKFGRGEPLQKPSNPDTVEKKLFISLPCLNHKTFFHDLP